MTDDDIDEVLKKDWIEVLNPYNGELIDQQMNKFVDLTKSFETEQAEHILRYQAKFYFVMGRYEQALTYLTKLLEFDTSNSFALRYRAETYYMIEEYEESLADLNKLLEINPNEIWVLKTHEFIKRNLDGKNIYDIYKMIQKL
jgi:tetratricopeptide (TPR) repeat protein